MCGKPSEIIDIQEDTVKQLEPFIANCKLISLHALGEPLTRVEILYRLIEMLPEKGKSQFNSNGLLLTKEVSDKLISYGSKVDNINFSIDAAIPETYFKIRHNDLEKVKNNIKYLSENRKQWPKIIINMCLMRENVPEVPLFVLLAKELNVDIVSLFHMNLGNKRKSGWFNYEDQHCSLDPQSHDTAIEEGFNLAKKIGVNLRMNGVRSFSKKTLPECTSVNECKSLKIPAFECPCLNNILIGTNLQIRNCCFQAKSIGSLADSSLHDIWFTNMKKYQEQAKNKQIPDICLGANCFKMSEKV
jgi:MoaA/NifB/PqqE/SkfB family radical SAM enzyme